MEDPLCILDVEHGTFTTFVKRWEDNQEHCSSVKIVKSKLMEEETVLKISEQIKTDYGIGRISLTDKRYCIRVRLQRKVG